jgi:hypothetical protein
MILIRRNTGWGIIGRSEIIAKGVSSFFVCGRNADRGTANRNTKKKKGIPFIYFILVLFGMILPSGVPMMLGVSVCTCISGCR